MIGPLAQQRMEPSRAQTPRQNYPVAHGSPQPLPAQSIPVTVSPLEERGNAQSSPRSPRRDNRSQVVQNKLSRGLNIMVELDSHVAALEQENAELKKKLILNRRRELAQCFNLEGEIFTTLAFQTWKTLIEEKRQRQKVAEMQRQWDHEKLMTEMCQEQFDRAKRILAQEQLKHADDIATIPYLREELRAASSLIASFGDVFSTCVQQCEKYPQPEPIVREEPDALIKIKEYMHRTLKEIDPRYLPPLNTPSVLEISQQQTKEFVERAGQMKFDGRLSFKSFPSTCGPQAPYTPPAVPSLTRKSTGDFQTPQPCANSTRPGPTIFTPGARLDNKLSSQPPAGPSQPIQPCGSFRQPSLNLNMRSLSTGRRTLHL